MNGKKIAYWIATVLFAAFMAFDAYAYLSHSPKMVAALASLGYPSYFINILGTAKVLGVVAILAPGTRRLKEWAYAGFTFTFIGAFFSHMSTGQQKESIMPLVALVIMVASYLLRPPDRRIAEAASA
ncbi:MAG TPA: DoxX family protein [Opitutaceae bacterium]|nr:DoxX family protein [Opitutaceae bacterium]